MDPIETFAATLQEAKKMLSSVGADQRTRQSPCAEWDVRGVVNHMTGGALMLAAGISGAPFAHVDDYIGDDPVGAFNAASDAALAPSRPVPSVLRSATRSEPGSRQRTRIPRVRRREHTLMQQNLGHDSVAVK